MLNFEGVSNISIDVAKHEVRFNYTTHNVLEGLREALTDIGYPITKDPNTIINKTKSLLKGVTNRISFWLF